MAVAARFGGPQRTVQPSAMVDLLNGWFATRKAMNDEASATTGEDPDKLVDMELEARDGLRRLNEALTKARSGDRAAASSLAEEMLRQKGGVARESIKQQGAVARQKIWLQGIYKQVADREADRMKADAQYSDEGKADVANIATFARSVQGATPEQIADRVAAQVEGVLQREKAGRQGDVQHDAIVRDAYNALKNEKLGDIADEMAKRLLKNVDVDPNAFFVAQHTPDDDETIQRGARKAVKGIGAGASPEIVDGWMQGIADEMGLEVGDILGDFGESESAASEGDGASGGGRPTGRVGVTAKGDLSPEAVRALGGIGGEDPYAAIASAIEAQAAYADELAQRRKAALAERSKSRFPRANPYLANPNSYTSDRDLRAVQIVGEGDPGYNREFASALTMEGGNVRRAEQRLTDTEPLYSPKTYLPFQVEDGGDLKAWLDREASAEPVHYWEESGWAYRVDPDLSITITEAPKGHKAGRTVRRDDPEWAAMAKTLNLADAPLSERVLSAQPKEVRDALRENATAGDIRAAYGRAMQRAADDPAAMGELVLGMAALPDDVRGSWADQFEGLIEEHAKAVPTGGYRASQAAKGSLRSLGLALEGSATSKGKRVATDRAEWREENRDRDRRFAEDEGRDLAVKAWTEAPDDAARERVRAGWATAHEKAPSDLTRGAMKALENPGSAERASKGVIPLVKEGADRGVDVVKPATSTVATPDLSREPSTIEPTAKGPDAEFAEFDAMLDEPMDFSEFDAFLTEDPK